jgi:hypothetical protein
MLKKIFVAFAILAGLAILYNIYLLATTKSHSPAEVAEFTDGSFKIAINYSRPYKRGRLIFGEGEEALVPFGEKWRTGANEATQISFSQNIYLEDSLLQKGTYSLYTIPGKNEWILAINSKTDYWGRTLVGDPFQESLDVVRVNGKVSQTDSEVEQFTINFTKSDSLVHLQMLWDRTKVTFNIKY